MRIDLRKRIFFNFVLVIALFGVLAAVLGVVLINHNILDEAQRRVSLDLRSAWCVFQNELDTLRLFVGVLGPGRRVSSAYADPESEKHRAALEAVRRQNGFDYLTLTDKRGRVILRTLEPYNTGDYLSNDPFITRALKGETVSGFAWIGHRRLQAEGGDLEERAFVVFEPTKKAKPRAKDSESSGMVLMAAAPVRDEKGGILGVLYAGTLLNRNHDLVDKIRSVVFEDKIYKGSHLGTVTIFQWDTRIATNVVNAKGNRAIGTRVSGDVYDKVLENNLNWYDRAFVVNDWYISAYDPIHDVEGKTVGILYVGVLAEKYDDLKRSLWKIYGGISFGVAVLVLGIGLMFSNQLTGSLRKLADAAGQISKGDLDLNVPEPRTDDEVLDLTRSFNAMAESLRDREAKLKATNEKLEEANTSLQQINANYLDMLGFVSHELKNTLGVIYTSARALGKGIAGNLNESQTALVRSISNSIDSAVNMTRSYLDLARIEKGELRVNKRSIDISDLVLMPVVEELKPLIAEKGARIEKNFTQGLQVIGDPDLLRIVYKNLLVNALKYGKSGGKIRLASRSEKQYERFEVWNEGEGIPREKIGRLFEKFVRLEHAKENDRGTGLGLFITKEIIEKQGGEIWAESEAGQWVNFIFTLPKALGAKG